MISAAERASRLIGEGSLRKLTDAGLIVEYHMSFPAGTRKVIGIVRELDTGEKYPYVDRDENGFEIIYASSHERNFAEWVSASNYEIVDVIG